MFHVHMCTPPSPADASSVYLFCHKRHLRNQKREVEIFVCMCFTL